MSAVEAGLEAGASYDEIVGTLIAVIPIVGVARVVSAAPNLALALGYDVPRHSSWSKNVRYQHLRSTSRTSQRTVSRPQGVRLLRRIRRRTDAKAA